MGSFSLKRKGSFVENSSVVVSGKVYYVGSCDTRPSKKLATDENIDEVTVGGLDAIDKTDMCLGQQTRCNREVVVGPSAGDICHEGSCTSELSADVVNVLKRKRSCVEEPLLQSDVRRRTDDVEVSAGVSHTVLEYACLTVNMLKRKGMDLEKPHLNSSNVGSGKVLHFDTGRCLSDLRVDTQTATWKKKRIIVEQGLGQEATNRLPRVCKSVANVQSTSFMHNVSESVSHNVAHTASFPAPVVLDFESGTVRPVAANDGYAQLTEAGVNSCGDDAHTVPFPTPVVLDFESWRVWPVAATDGYDKLSEAVVNSCNFLSHETGFAESVPETLIVTFSSEATIREPVTNVGFTFLH